MNPVAKTLIIGGIVLIGVGLFWQFGSKYLPLGRLPGDIAIKKEGFSFHFPLMTCVVLSIVLSLLFKLFQK